MVLWDTAGVESHSANTTLASQLASIYRNPDGAVFVYDVNNDITLHSLTYWVSDILLKTLAETSTNPVRTFLIGNKFDVPQDGDTVGEDAVRNWAEEQLPECFQKGHLYRTSAKLGLSNGNVRNVFQKIATALYRESQSPGEKSPDSSLDRQERGLRLMGHTVPGTDTLGDTGRCYC